MFKIVLTLFLAYLLLISFLSQMPYVSGTSQTVVKVEPYISTANVTETFTVSITVYEVENLYGIEATLCWDDSVLHVLNIDVRLGQSDGVLCNPFLIAMNSTQKGKFILAATSYAPSPSFSGNGNIVRITFEVINSNDSRLDLETKLYDYPPPDREPRISYPIDHVTIDGLFEIIPEFQNTIILLLFMISTIATLVLSKRILRKSHPP